MSQLPVPKEFDYSRPDGFTDWLKQFKLYRIANGLINKGRNVQIATLLYTMGGDSQQLYDTFSFTKKEDKDNFDVVTKALQDYFTPKRNTIHLRSQIHVRNQTNPSRILSESYID